MELSPPEFNSLTSDLRLFLKGTELGCSSFVFALPFPIKEATALKLQDLSKALPSQEHLQSVTLQGKGRCEFAQRAWGVCVHMHIVTTLSMCQKRERKGSVTD